MSATTTVTAAKKQVVIVGGVAGGASAAARLRRMAGPDKCEITLFERGEYVSFANCGLAYHIGGQIKDRDRLFLATPQSLVDKFQLDLRMKTEVIGIDTERKEITAVALASGVKSTMHYDALILSPGASPTKPPIPGIDHPRIRFLRDVPSMDAIKALVVETKTQTPPLPVLVLGGGYIGLEVAEAIVDQKLPCMLVEFADQVMVAADPEMTHPLHQELVQQGVDLRLSCTVASFTGADNHVIAKLTTGEEVMCSFAVVAIGVRPEVTLAKQAGIKLGERGGILVDEYLETSAPSVYAVGDAIEVKDYIGGFQTLIPLAGPANRQGRIVGTNLFTEGKKLTYKNTQGTAVCKVFGMTIAMTGENEKTLKRINRQYNKVYTHGMHHASYYPGGQMLSMKLVYDPSDGRILGAQAFGREGVDKRIDVVAVAIRSHMTVFDLEDLELCYAPPYGSAKDPVNMAGFIASNLLRGEFNQIHAEELKALLYDEAKVHQTFVLDVRQPEELFGGKIINSINIPLPELQTRLHELPRDRTIIVACGTGLRSYNATRLLCNKGFNAVNLSGGFRTWVTVTDNGAKKWMKSVVGTHVATTDSCSVSASGVVVSSSQVNGGVVVSTKPPQEIDAVGLKCPIPIIRTSRAFSTMDPGDTVIVTASDPSFQNDIPVWCRSTGNTLVKLEQVTQGTRATIRKGIIIETPQEPLTSASAAAPTEPVTVVKEVDATGMQCPGPILKLAQELSHLNFGQCLAITASDGGFAHDLPAWCRSTGNSLLSLDKTKDGHRAVIHKGPSAAQSAARSAGAVMTTATSSSSAAAALQSLPDMPLGISSKKKTIVVFSNDFDKVMAAFIIANGAAAMGSQVTMFFTFWGLTVIKSKITPVSVKKGWLDSMFGYMLPAGPGAMSKMNFFGLGGTMVKNVMAMHKVATLEELIDNAKQAGVRFIACSMAMELLGVAKEELIDGVEIGGVAMYLAAAEEGNVNLFIG